MSPFGRGGFYQAKPRIAVEGGVVVPKPGVVSHPAAQEIIEAAAMETKPAILSRGRTYARAGQVIGVQSEEGLFTATIQGSSRRPYEVRLATVRISGSDRIDATCSCPYSCDYDWCKHAAALAYVAAFLVDTQPEARAVWDGDEVPLQVSELTGDDVDVLRSDPPVLSFAERLTAVQHIAPWPGSVPGGDRDGAPQP